MDYMCGDCGSDNVVEVGTFGSATIEHMCALCGSQYILGVDLSPKYRKTMPPSVGQMLHRQRKVEAHLPPSPMEEALAAKRNAAVREDLVELLTELA